MEAEAYWQVELGRREIIAKKTHVIIDSAGRAYEFVLTEGPISTPESARNSKGRLVSRGKVNVTTRLARTYTSKYKQTSDNNNKQVLQNWEYSLDLKLSSEGKVVAECMGKWSGVFTESNPIRTGAMTNSSEMDFPQLHENSNLWIDGKKLILDITYKLKVNESVQKSEKSAGEKKSPLLRHLTSKRNSDAVIKCGVDSLDVHKLVLSFYSPVFSRMFALPLEESTTNTIRIEDFPAETVKDMISFMYEGTFNSASTNSLVALLDCSEKYEICELKALVLQKMIESLSPQNAVEFAAASAKYEADENTKEKLFDYCKSNFQNLRTSEEFKKFFKGNVDLFL